MQSTKIDSGGYMPPAAPIIVSTGRPSHTTGELSACGAPIGQAAAHGQPRESAYPAQASSCNPNSADARSQPFLARAVPFHEPAMLSSSPVAPPSSTSPAMASSCCDGGYCGLQRCGSGGFERDGGSDAEVSACDGGLAGTGGSDWNSPADSGGSFECSSGAKMTRAVPKLESDCTGGGTPKFCATTLPDARSCTSKDQAKATQRLLTSSSLDKVSAQPTHEDWAMKNGSYSLVRHNSAVFEHDFATNQRSLIRAVSEVRKEMELGLRHGAKDGHDNSDPSKPGKPKGTPGSLVRQVSHEKHEFSQETFSSPTPGEKGQINSFVLKNYALHDSRTLSSPVGKDYSIRQSYVGQSTVMQSHLDTALDSSPGYVTYSEQRRTSVSSSSTCGGNEGHHSKSDFDMEAERHSKSVLYFQAGFTLLTVMAAMFTLYFCIRFLTSSNPQVDELSWLSRNGSSALDRGQDGYYSYCRLFAKAFPLLGLFTAGFVVMAGAWVLDGRLWRWSPTPPTTSCGHCCEGHEENNRRQAQEADEKVRRADRSKQQFMAYVFHNIRVPFNAIVLGLGHIRALGDGGGMIGSGADKTDLVQMMLDCAETMTSVLDDVTDMGEWEGGQMELHKDEFDILAVIRFLSWGLQDLLEQKTIAFNMNIDEFASKLLTEHRVIGDKQRVVQTLGNFLSNAVKFTPSGGKLDLDLQCEEVVERKNIEEHVVNLGPTGSTTEGSFLGAAGIQILTKPSFQMKIGVEQVARLRLSVKDNGIGISTQDQAKLFEPYSFVTSGWVLKAGVSGLGLSMAKRFVEQAGGSIGVESEEGSGSNFFFSIPFPLVRVDISNEREQQAKLDTEAAVLQKSEVTQSKTSSGVTFVHESITLSRRRSNQKQDLKPALKIKPAIVLDVKNDAPHVFTKKTKPDGVEGAQMKVLLVEDTRINRIILRKVLQNLNLECDEAENGQIAVDLHKQGNVYGLVLMDKEMPVMDGHEATRQLRNMGVKTPIVALTGNALTTDRELFFEAGVDDFQTKPLSREKLVQLLLRYGVENTRLRSSKMI